MKIHRTTRKDFNEIEVMRNYYGVGRVFESLTPEFKQRRSHDIGLVEAMRAGAEQIKERFELLEASPHREYYADAIEQLRRTYRNRLDSVEYNLNRLREYGIVPRKRSVVIPEGFDKFSIRGVSNVRIILD